MAACKRAALAMLLAGGCAQTDDRAGAPIYSYVRSNRDGSEAEAIHVYRPRADYVEVAKMRERCTDAAFVTATMVEGEPLRLTGGRLRPGAAREDFAELTYRDGRRAADPPHAQHGEGDRAKHGGGVVGSE
jgi:hypothetical protein